MKQEVLIVMGKDLITSKKLLKHFAVIKSYKIVLLLLRNHIFI